MMGTDGFYLTGMTAAQARACGMNVPDAVPDCAVFEPLPPFEIKKFKFLDNVVKVNITCQGQWKWVDATFIIDLK